MNHVFLDAERSQIYQSSIYQFFGRQHENRHAIKNSQKRGSFPKSYKNTVFEKYAENREKNILSLYFYFL